MTSLNCGNQHLPPILPSAFSSAAWRFGGSGGLKVEGQTLDTSYQLNSGGSKWFDQGSIIANRIPAQIECCDHVIMNKRHELGVALMNRGGRSGDRYKARHCPGVCTRPLSASRERGAYLWA